MAPKASCYMRGKAKAKAKGVKQGVTKKTGANAPSQALEKQVRTCQLACNFRNTMKYRMSDDCKKALGLSLYILLATCARGLTPSVGRVNNLTFPGSNNK